MKKKKLIISFLLVISISIVFLVGYSTSTRLTKKTNTAEAQKKQAVQVSPGLVDQWKASKHAKSYNNFLLTPIAQGGYAEYNCWWGCHNAKTILGEEKVTDDHYKKYLDGGQFANDREGITCRVCHTLDSKGISLRVKGWDTCTNCHNSEDVQDGDKVGHPHKEMFFGYQLGDKKIEATPHSKVLNSCTDCHITNSSKHDFLPPKDYKVMFDQPKCKTCHFDSKGSADKLKADQKAIKTRLTKYKPIWTKQWIVYQNFTTPGTPENMMQNKPAEVEAFLNDFSKVVSKWSWVYYDYSNGAHNFNAAKELLDYSEPKLDEIQKKYKAVIDKYSNGSIPYKL